MVTAVSPRPTLITPARTGSVPAASPVLRVVPGTTGPMVKRVSPRFDAPFLPRLFRPLAFNPASAIACREDGIYRFSELSADLSRLYYQGKVPNFFPKVFPEARQRFLQAMSRLVGREQALRWEYALLVFHQGNGRPETLSMVDVRDQLPVVRRIFQEASRLTIDENRALERLSRPGAIAMGVPGNLSVAQLNRDVDSLKRLCLRALKTGSLDYAELTFIANAYANSVAIVNYEGVLNPTNEYVPFPKGPDPVRDPRNYMSGFPIKITSSYCRYHLVFPSFKNIDGNNYADFYRTHSSGLLVAGLTPARARGESYDGMSIAPETPGYNFIRHDYTHIWQRADAMEALMRGGHRYNHFFPHSFQQLLTSRHPLEKVLGVLAWSAEKRLLFEERIQGRSAKFQKIAQLVWCLLDREEPLMSEDSLRLYQSVSIILRQLVQRGEKWQDFDLSENERRFLPLQDHRIKFIDAFRNRLLDSRRNLWEMLGSLKPREVSTQEWLEAFEFVGEVLELPRGLNL